MRILPKYNPHLITAWILLLSAVFLLISGGNFQAQGQDLESNGTDTFQFSKLEVMMFDTLNNSRQTSFGLNAALTRTARILGQRMIDNDFSSQTDEIDFKQLVSGFGYGYKTIFKLEAAVMSSNYLSDEKAVDLLYSSLMEKDTDHLNSPFQEVGISIIRTSISIKGKTMNGCVAVVLGADPDSESYSISNYMADQLEVLLNQFRANPEFVLRNMGYDPDSYSGETVITTGLPPFRRGQMEEVRSGEALTSDAVDVNVDMEAMDTDRAVMRLFSQMVETKINSLLTDASNRVYIYIDFVPFYDEQGKYWFRFTAKLKFDPLMPEMNKVLIKGVAYKDLNKNQMYDPGEGLQYLPLYIPGTGIQMRTGAAGQFQTELEMGWYDILLFNIPAGEYSVYYDTYTMNKYVMFSVME